MDEPLPLPAPFQLPGARPFVVNFERTVSLGFGPADLVPKDIIITPATPFPVPHALTAAHPLSLLEFAGPDFQMRALVPSASTGSGPLPQPGQDPAPAAEEEAAEAEEDEDEEEEDEEDEDEEDEDEDEAEAEDEEGGGGEPGKGKEGDEDDEDDDDAVKSSLFLLYFLTHLPLPHSLPKPRCLLFRPLLPRRSRPLQ